ncbi:hypothetical protein [Burkholderia stagnalis]
MDRSTRQAELRGWFPLTEKCPIRKSVDQDRKSLTSHRDPGA